MKEMEKYRNEYLLLEDEKIIAHSKDLMEILVIAEKYPQEKVRITRLLSEQANFFNLSC